VSAAILEVLDQTIELCARHKEALAEIVRLRAENGRLLQEVAELQDEIRVAQEERSW
jgi:hypothetical protein